MAVKIEPKVKKATVTFTTPARKDASQAILTGEWDNWEACVMKKSRDGSFSVKVNLDLGKAYQFGYSIDGSWTPDADLPSVISPFGTHNSILVIEGDKILVTEGDKKKTVPPKTEKIAAKKEKQVVPAVNEPPRTKSRK